MNYLKSILFGLFATFSLGADAWAQSCATIGTLTGTGARSASTSAFMVTDGDTVTVAVTGFGGAEVEVAFLGDTFRGIVDFTHRFVVSGVGSATGSVDANIITGITGVDISVTCSVGTAPPPPPTTPPSPDQTTEDSFRRNAALRFASDSIAELVPNGGVPLAVGVNRGRFSFAGSLSGLRDHAAKARYTPDVVEPGLAAPEATASVRTGPAIAGGIPTGVGAWDIWTRGSVTLSESGTAEATQGTVLLGATYVHSPSQLIGATLILGQGQTTATSRYDSRFAGVTIYGSRQGPSGLSFSPYLSYLNADTDVTQGTATGSYRAKTVTLGARLSARQETQVSDKVLRYFEPNAELAHGWDRRPAYTLSNATTIAAASENFGALRLGPTWGKITENPSAKVARLEQRFGMSLDWAYADQGIQQVGVSAELAGSLGVAFKSGGVLSLTARAGGLGGDLRSYSLGVQFTRATR